VGDLVRDRLELRNGMTVLPARAAVLGSLLEQPLQRADVASAEQRALPVHRLREDRCAAADLAHDVFARHERIFENHLGDERGSEAELLELLAGRETRRAFLDEEGRDT